MYFNKQNTSEGNSPFNKDTRADQHSQVVPDSASAQVRKIIYWGEWEWFSLEKAS